jgi:hypothetical protein
MWKTIEASRKASRAASHNILLAALGCMTLVACQMRGPDIALDPPDASPAKRMVTQGQAKKIIVPNLTSCAHTHPKMNLRVAAVGEITASDGTVITVPADTALQRREGPLSHDLYNECNKVTPPNAAAVSTDKVPVHEIDADGEVVTGFIVADNYFELYVNGRLVSVDNTPYTPFNSAIVKFRVKRPYTMAFLLVDWDEHLALGVENMARLKDSWYLGDGGLIAKFSDGTVTDSSWKAQAFMVGPLDSPNDVVEKGNVHFFAKNGRTYPHVKKPVCRDDCYMVHYAYPKNWRSRTYNDSDWPRAYEYTDEEIGVTTLQAYTRYPELFAGARWIWSSNLVYDNAVIARKVVR